MSAPQKIALFGGSFDPVHAGHLEIASKAVRSLDLDLLVFIPCRRSPHKEQSPGAGDRDRLKMLELATADLPWAVVDDLELHRPPPSYTWETIAHFDQKYPAPHQLLLLIGADQWGQLSQWKNPEFLSQKVTFIVVGRDDQPTPRPGFRAHFIAGNHPASSSKIRESLSLKQSPRWLPAPVEAFIHKKGLYSPTA